MKNMRKITIVLALFVLAGGCMARRPGGGGAYVAPAPAPEPTRRLEAPRLKEAAEEAERALADLRQKADVLEANGGDPATVKAIREKAAEVERTAAAIEAIQQKMSEAPPFRVPEAEAAGPILEALSSAWLEKAEEARKLARETQAPVAPGLARPPEAVVETLPEEAPPATGEAATTGAPPAGPEAETALLYVRIRGARAAGRLDDVIGLYREAEAAGGTPPPDIRVIYARSLAEEGRFADAVAAAEPALDEPEALPDPLRTRFDLANWEYALGRFDLAKASYEKVIAGADALDSYIKRSEERLLNIDKVKDRREMEARSRLAQAETFLAAGANLEEAKAIARSVSSDFAGSKFGEEAKDLLDQILARENEQLERELEKTREEFDAGRDLEAALDNLRRLRGIYVEPDQQKRIADAEEWVKSQKVSLDIQENLEEQERLKGRLEEARTALKAGRCDEAKEIFRELFDTSLDEPAHQGFEQAEKCNFKALLDKAQAAYKAGECDKAAAMFLQLFDSPLGDEAKKGRSRAIECYVKQQRTEAMKLFQKAVKTKEQDKALERFGEAYHILDDLCENWPSAYSENICKNRGIVKTRIERLDPDFFKVSLPPTPTPTPTPTPAAGEGKTPGDAPAEEDLPE